MGLDAVGYGPMDESVNRMLEKSAALNERLADLFAAPRPPQSPRELLTVAMCSVAMEHWFSQRLLIEAGCHTTAMALVRLQFEFVVRAIWMHHGATDKWIEAFTSPMQPGQLSEPILGPGVEPMLETIARTAPAQIGAMLQQLKAGAWQPMHSYVHGGVRSVAQTLAGATPYQLTSVLRNANGLAMLAANLLMIVENDSSKAGRIREIQIANLDCLPPLNPEA